MRSLREWPALAAGPAWPDKLEYSRAVWGKVHAATSDYRWIALGSGQVPDKDFHQQFAVGAEDLPEKTLLWQNRDGRCHAVKCYSSRAMDASGRTGFLEKQVLSWDTASLPAALGALVLLPEAAKLTDDIWWDRYKNQQWSDPDFSLTIEPSAHEPLAVREKDLAAAVEQGIEEIRSTIGNERLEALYATILSGRKPAFLPGLRQPLSAAALAALLLPLHRERADSLSLAAWVPSRRATLEELRALWNVVVLPPGLAELAAGTPEIDRHFQKEGRRLANMLLGLEPVSDLLADLPPVPFEPEEKAAPPARRAERPFPGHTIDLAAPPTRAPEPLKRLHDFAVATDRRWLEAEKLDARPCQLDPRDSPIPAWIYTLGNQRPSWVDNEQWEVKLDLLRSAAFVLHPRPEMVKTVGLPTTGRVPALYCALRPQHALLSRAELDLLGKLGQPALQEVLEQSLRLGVGLLGSQVRALLRYWRGVTELRNIREMIDLALAA